MVVPLALRADDGDVELLVQRGHGDIKAIDLLAQAVGIGDGVGRRLQERRAVLPRVLRRAAEEVQNALGRQADVDRHLAVFDRQRTLALAGLVHVEHTAVGVEVCGVNAVGERGLSVVVLRIAVLILLPAAEKQRAEHQGGQHQCQCSFHWEIPPSGKGSEAVHNRFGALWVYLRVQGVNGGLGVGDVERLHIGDLAEARDLAVDGEVGSLEHGLPGIVVAAGHVVVGVVTRNDHQRA